MRTIKKHFNYHVLLGISIIIGLINSSCSSPKSTNLLQEKKPVYTAKAFQDYKLQINDEISCSIFTNNKDFSDSFNGAQRVDILQGLQGVVSTTSAGNGSIYTIYDTGNISIPFFGEIHLLGLSIAEAEDAIQDKMRQAIPDAQVKIFLNNNKYYIVSEGKNGSYDIYKDNMTIYQALAISGIPNTDYEIGKVKIIRQDETGRSIIKQFDLRSESIIESEFYYIKPNDMIYYSTSKTAFFRITSFQSLVSTLLAPVSAVLTILAFRINFN